MTATVVPQGHSPLGASGSHRWMTCPGSVPLSEGIEDPESDHAKLGTAAHALAAECLQTNQDAWMFVGRAIGNHPDVVVIHPDPDEPTQDWPSMVAKAGWTPVDKDMADAVQVYLEAVRTAHPDRNQSNFFVERRFHCPTIHPLFYGTADLVYAPADGEVHVWDYKHGAGIVVEADNNPQLMYYAAGVLEHFGMWDDCARVVLHIAQPRGWHWDGPIREWTVSTQDLLVWLEDKLVPAMGYALTATETKSGEHCRFCPARLRACPQIAKDMDELEGMMTATTAAELTPAQAGRFLELFDQAKIYNKAAEHVAFGMMMAGNVVPGRKLAESRVNREFRETAEIEEGKRKKTVPVKVLALLEFGDDCMSTPELLSPAALDKLPGGKAFTARHAYKKPGQLTVVKSEDAREAVNRDTKSMFTDQTKKTA